ncbi:hypothetical protein GCM10027596_37040 [Nocardioides korecus]
MTDAAVEIPMRHEVPAGATRACCRRPTASGWSTDSRAARRRCSARTRNQAERSLHRLLELRGARLLMLHGPELDDPWDALDHLLDR